MTDHDERRDRARFPGQVLFIKIGFKPYPLIDVSVGGVGFESEGLSVGQIVNIKIVSVLDETDNVDAKCEVLNIVGYRVAARFIDPSETLLSYIKSYIKNWS